MAWVNLQEFKDYYRSEQPTASDAILTSALDAAHWGMRNACQRDFSVVGASSARSYVPDGTDILDIHDCTGVTAVVLNGTTLDSATYQLEPVGLDWTGENGPYTLIRRLLAAWYILIPGKASVTVTATWGWAATPPRIVEATKVLAKDIAGNRDVQQGLVAVTDAAGVGARSNVFVRDVICDYRGKKSWGLA